MANENRCSPRNQCPKCGKPNRDAHICTTDEAEFWRMLLERYPELNVVSLVLPKPRQVAA